MSKDLDMAEDLTLRAIHAHPDPAHAQLSGLSEPEILGADESRRGPDRWPLMSPESIFRAVRSLVTSGHLWQREESRGTSSTLYFGLTRTGRAAAELPEKSWIGKGPPDPPMTEQEIRDDECMKVGAHFLAVAKAFERLGAHDQARFATMTAATVAEAHAHRTSADPDFPAEDHVKNVETVLRRLRSGES